MGNKLKNQKEKLAERQRDYEAVPSELRNQGAFTKPGSMNRKKQGVGSTKRRVKRR